MAKRKFGHDDYGYWSKDEDGLPSYVLDLCQVSPLIVPLRHVFGTGSLNVLADHRGTIQIFPGDVLTVCSPTNDLNCRQGLLSLSFRRGTDPYNFLCGHTPTDGRSEMVWGIGYARYDMSLPQKQGFPALSVSASIATPPGESCCLIEISVTNCGERATSVSIEVAVNACMPENIRDASRGFQQSGIAVVADAHERLGDLYLASDPEWRGTAGPMQLALEREVELARDGTVTFSLVAGYSKTCTVAWLEKLLQRLNVNSARKAWAERTDALAVKAPELWMREECLWATGRALTFAAAGAEKSCLLYGGSGLFRPGSRSANVRPSDGIRDLLILSMPSVLWESGLALGALTAVGSRQDPSGRLLPGPEEEKKRQIDARTDPGDLEIWFLAAWVHYIATSGDISVLDKLIPYSDGTLSPLWEHLSLAGEWIRYHLGEGPHGLVRALSCDANPLLDRCGSAGVGESVLNTAVLCFALQHLIVIARQRGESRKLDEWTEWRRRLLVAVEYCFQGSWFRRGYTDTGRPFGDTDDARAFADVQAWAVLARCGTAQQREQAIAAVLKGSSGSQIRSLTKPFSLPIPVEISSSRLPPGSGFNGGIVLRDAAWVLWALASIGKQDEAMKRWEKLTIRYQSSANPTVPAAYLMNFCCRSLPETAPGGAPGVSACGEVEGFPTAHATAWIDFGMRRILTPDIKIPPPSPIKLN